MTSTFAVTPDTQTVRPVVGSTSTFKFVPTTPPDGTPFDLTAFNAITAAKISPNNNAQKNLTYTLPISLDSTDTTSATMSISEVDSASIVDLGQGLNWTGYITLDNGGGITALIWAGQLQISANPAQIIDFT